MGEHFLWKKNPIQAQDREMFWPVMGSWTLTYLILWTVGYHGALFLRFLCYCVFHLNKSIKVWNGVKRHKRCKYKSLQYYILLVSVKNKIMIYLPFYSVNSLIQIWKIPEKKWTKIKSSVEQQKKKIRKQNKLRKCIK